MGKSLREKLQTDTLVLDGAFGTYIQSIGLDNSHFGEHPGCMEYLSVVSPDLISKVHADYLEAGSDAVETNTFGGNFLKLSEYGLAEKVYEINLASTLLARKEADRFSTPDDPRYVIGTMGPTGKLPSSGDPSMGDITYGELKDIFFRQAAAIIDGGADAILVETGQDLLEMKAAVNGARKAASEKNKDVVLMAQCTLANNGRMLLGTEVSAFMAVMGNLGLDVIGLNCSTGPAEMEPAIKFLSENAHCSISCVPNAGLPVDEDGRTVYPLSPEEMASIVSSFALKYRVDVIGGCCGTTPRHITEIKKALSPHEKRGLKRKSYAASSYRAFDIGGITRPIKVGERMNTQGSRKMKDLLTAGDYDSIVELGKLQEKQGALVLDLCTVLTERSTEKKDTAELTRRVAESVEVPLMIDSTDEDVIAGALESYPGTAFINSANLEDGGEKAGRIFDLAFEHGALVVCLVIDENGMARTAEKKLEVAARLYSLAVDDRGIEPSRLIFDMLTFTLGTGEKEYATSALDTLEAIKAFKKQYPGALTVLGVSNVSFGLKRSSRKVLNSVFLENAVKAGLDMAIVNPAEYQEDVTISDKEKTLAEDLIFNVSPGALDAFVEYFTNASPESMKPASSGAESRLSIEEKLTRCVLERDKTNIVPLIDEAREKYPPEVIINEILMETMRDVGDKLDSGEIVLPYVLQSAEVMKKAIEYLESFLPKNAVSKRGKVILATVAGDVHDIGKNLVKMILKNNGFSVIDLGKQVPVETIIEEAEKNKVDAVGLSALLVSTSRHMKTCVQHMHEAGLDYPVILGGAPVNERFTRSISLMADNSFYKGGVFYARDAFTGLKIMQALVNKAGKEKALKEYADACARPEDISVRAAFTPDPTSKKDKAFEVKLPEVPFKGPRTITNIPVDEVFKHLDKRMLFDLSWGSGKVSGSERTGLIEKEYGPKLLELKEESIRKGWLDLKAVYGYFDCLVKDGRRMEILGPDGERVEVLDLTPAPDGMSIADNFAPGGDIVAFQAVTIGGGITEAVEELGGRGEASKAFYLHGIGVNLAEALAAYVHDRIRAELGLGKGEGRRYSPGYPLWEDLEDQRKIFALLDVEKRIGVRLTEDCQMVPEQSTTAMVVRRNSFNK
jgi:5-methyltetrahydrofolate--homocysteine methyltransferase